MAIIDDKSKSDGLEILSIGSLYAGPWDKKYWSSSRGKDRYPYPVGYQALRMHNGLTYKMEIHEGSKGPIFQITSNDKHLGSGETPDRACENFQKKCNSRIKLWHGKRSSGKIDGVEFFGFKNALVQRLLRELVATLNDASDQSSVVTNCNEASSKGHDVGISITDGCPDLKSYLEKTTVTGKRSRNCRGADKKSVSKNGHGICQSPHQGDHAELLCSAPGTTDVNEPLISCALSDCHADRALQVTSNKVHGVSISLSEQGLPVKSPEIPVNTKDEPCSLQKQNELSSMDTCTTAPLVGVDVPQEEKPFDRQAIEFQGVSLSVSTEEHSQKVQTSPDLLAPGLRSLSDSQANHNGELCVLDTLDTQQEFTCAPNVGSHGEEAAMAKNEPVADSVFSEESEFDSAEDITKSMMAILLPRAIPLLKYSSRKKRKTKPPTDFPCAPKSENNLNGATPSTDVKSPAGLPACSTSDGQAKVHPPSVIASGLSMMDTVRDVVPDSLDNDQDENYVPNEPPSSSANFEAVAANLQETDEPDEKQLSKNDCFLAPHCDLPCPSSADAITIPVEKCSKNMDLEIMPVNSALEMRHRSGNLVSPKSCQVSAFGGGNCSKASFTGGRSAGHISNLQKDNVEDALAQNCKLQDQVLSFTFIKDDKQFLDGCNSYSRNFRADTDMDNIRTRHSDSVYQSQDQGRGPFQNCASQFKSDAAETESNYVDKQEFDDAIEYTMKLIGCYSHPMQISSVMLTRKLHEIYMCVSCGLSEEKKRDLFLYKLSVDESSLGSPCIAGHTSMNLPALKDEFGREIAVDKSGLQFTPDAKGLVLVDSIRMPYCREKNLHCLCPQCESCCFEENAVKIVQIKLGYVSPVVKLNTIYPVQCVLVCGPDHLIAVDESGRIYIWIMNSTWSLHTEVYVIPSNDFLPSRVVELKRIPKLASMVVGHNGYGEFSLWDIIRRTSISRFSAPASSVLDFLPVSMLNSPSNALSHNKADMEQYVTKLEEATMLWFTRHNEANILCSMEGEDFAVWLLICTSADSSALSPHHSNSYHVKSDGCWRLGLLIKDMVILGAALQLSCTAIGSASGTGIIGTDGGQVYVWELATGNKLKVLDDLEGNRVLHIATDDTTSSVVAIAGDGGQLCVYLHTRDLVKSA